jgi:nicotinamidase-related amidase
MKQHRSAFSETGLGDLLRDRQVDHVVLVGSQSAFCVDMAGKHALAEGFHVTLVSDGHINGTTRTADGPVSDATVRALINRTWSSLSQPGLLVSVKPAREVAW